MRIPLPEIFENESRTPGRNAIKIRLISSSIKTNGYDTVRADGWKMKDGRIWIGSFRAKQVLNIKN